MWSTKVVIYSHLSNKRACTLIKEVRVLKLTWISGNLEKITLSTHDTSQCGGNSAFIELLQDSISCKTKDIGEFGSGTTLVWAASNLDTCCEQEFDVFNDEINFKTMSNDGNDYCPKTLTITMNNGYAYKKEGIIDWVDNGKNNHLQSAKRTSGKVLCTLYSLKFRIMSSSRVQIKSTQKLANLRYYVRERA